ncbi:MAG: serine hydrolase domain-containing protein [Gemmatimonadota bacterium]
MRTLFAALTLGILILLLPAPLQAQDDLIREAVDALVDVLAAPGDAALEEYLQRRVSTSYRASLGGAEGVRTLLREVREAARGTLGSVEVGAEDRGLVLRLSAERSAEIGLALDADGRLTRLEVLSTMDEPASPPSGREAAVEERMLAIEGLPMSGIDGFAEEHFTTALQDEIAPDRMRPMLEVARDAAASAGMVSVELAPEGFLLTFRGGRPNADVLFDIEDDAPYRISSFDVVVLEDAPPGSPVRSLRWEDLEGRLEEAHERGMSGTILAVRGGSTFVDRSFGMADRSASQMNDASTIYGIGSLPIDFTRAGALLLIQRGDLRLDDLVSIHVPGVPDDKSTMTVGHLLRHESGLPNFHHRVDVDDDFDLSWISREEAERRILGAELLFEPGQERLPSHSAVGLLAAIVERVSGQPYQDFMRTKFFEPFGMGATGPYGDDLGQPMSRFATGYGSSAVGEPNVPPHWGETSWLVQGSGGMVSNPADMRRWFEGLRQGRVLAGPALEMYLDRGSALGASDRGFFFGHFWGGGDDMIFLAINGGSDSDAVQELIRSLMALVHAEEAADR